ncbi:unnamed protein product, partial [Musa acuminata subsp. burmannicoides]
TLFSVSSSVDWQQQNMQMLQTGACNHSQDDAVETEASFSHSAVSFTYNYNTASSV